MINSILRFLSIGSSAPNRETLDALVAAYIRRVPWESASRIVRRAAYRAGQLEQAVAWPEQFWSWAMANGTGGTCFESNYAMLALLRGLGYEARLTINSMGETEQCHTALLVDLPDEQWLVDVGIPLHVPVRIDPQAASKRGGPWLTYTLVPDGEERYQVLRDPHPKPYIFTLASQPVDEQSYRDAMIADYQPSGFFLDKVIITRVIGAHIWRFSSAEQPFHIEQFLDGCRIDYALDTDPAPALSRHFGMDEHMIRVALEVTQNMEHEVGMA